MAKTIGDYKKDYEAARAAGDAAGMKAANDGANAIRAQMGQAAQVASDDIALIAGRSQSGSGGSSSGSRSGGSSGSSGGGTITGPGSTGGAGSRSNGAAAWTTGRDESGDIDYSVLLRSAMETGNSDIDYLTGLINSRTDKAIDKGMPQYASDDFTKEVWEYINGLKGSQQASALAQQQQYYQDLMAMMQDQVRAPVYQPSEWDQTKEALAKAALGMQYDDWAQSDQYKALADRYGHQGKLTMQDLLGQISARTGGLASSYAATAAQQQYNEYMAQLEEVARQMYAGERQDALQNAQLAFDFADDDYQRYLDQLSQFDKDRSFSFDVLSKALEQSRYADEWQRTLDRDARSDFESDRAFQYGVDRDAVADARYEDELAYGRGLDAYSQGITSRDDARTRIAYILAETGGSLADVDPALITQSGLTTAELNAMMREYKQSQAQLAARSSGGGSSGRSSGGGSGSGGGRPSATAQYDFDGLFKAAKASGNPNSFISNHYKEYGFTSSSGLTTDYKNWAASAGDSMDINWGSVNALGYGPISQETLTQLVGSGEVEAYEQDGQWYFRRVKNKGSSSAGRVGNAVNLLF